MSTLYPIGTILPYAGEFNSNTETNLINEGYIPCDGRALVLANYQPLYQVIGDAYGEDSNGNFYVPDYRGRFLRGTDLGAGVDPDAASRTAPTNKTKPGNTGDAVGSIQAGEIQAHTHSYTTYHDSHLIDVGGLETPGVYTTSTSTGTSSSYGGKETRPVNANINYVIVYM